jgi:hypothetical protein
MSLSLQPNFVAKTNNVMILVQTAGIPGLSVRVASLSSGILGTLTASGAAGTTVYTVSPSAPSFLTSAVDSTGSILTLSFSSALPGTDPFEFYVTATDGVTTLYFPILLEVKEPFYIKESSSDLTTLIIPSYDSTVTDTTIVGVGLNGTIVSGVNFIPPVSLPSGLNFIDKDGTTAILHVNDPSPTSMTTVSGGLQLVTPVSAPLTLSAYRPGSFYDSPDRAFTKTFQVSSLTSKVGTIDVIADVYYDNANSRFQLDFAVNYLQGQNKSLQYLWVMSGTATGSFTGASGNVTSTGLVSSQWTPSGGGSVTFTLTVSDQAVPHTVYATKTLGSFQTSTGSTTWAATNAIKLQLSTAPGGAGLYQGYAGDTVNVVVSAVAAGEFNAETFTLAITSETGSSLEAGLSALGPYSLTSSSLTATIPVVIPVTADPSQKWGIKISANNGSPTTRTGFAEATVRSYGKRTLVINGGSAIPISTQTGATMTPVTLTSTDVVTASPISATYSLIGAPDGVFISSNQIIGNALTAGTYTFHVYASSTGYAPSQSGLVTLTVTQNAAPLMITTPTVVGVAVNPASEPDNTNYNIQWSLTGTPVTLKFLQSTSSSGSRNVLGVTQAATSQPTTSVISVYGSSYYGTSYSLPIIVLSSSIQASSQLLGSLTIGTLDSGYNLTLNWQPYVVSGGYTAYRAWDIYLTKIPGGTPQLQTLNGSLPTGLEFPGSTLSNRIYETVLASGDYAVNMTALTTNPSLATNSAPWDQSHKFPTELTSSSVSLSIATTMLGQPVVISLNPAYAGADSWSVTYQDNTTTGFVPLSVRSFAKSFSTPGTQTVTITSQNDFSNSNPPVKLRRTYVLSLFVTNQQFSTAQTGAGDLTGTLGISGDQGFEIVDATAALVKPEPWEVASRSLVRDTVTNELKLLVATSRFNNASSLLDTMALDVFPLQGRPLSKELLNLPDLLSPGAILQTSTVKISTVTLPTVIVGKPMTEFKLQAISGNPPYSWYTDFSLPSGLTLSIDGTLSGTPLALGNFTVNFSVADANGSIASASFPFSVQTDLVITTSSLPAAKVNTPYSVQMTNTGGLPPYAWAIVSGALPLGIMIDSSTGLLHGIPVTYNSTTDFNLTYSGTIQVSDAIGARVSKVFTVALSPADLGFGVVSQSTVYASDQFKLSVPVFGGKSPYTLTAFTDDGIIGSGLQIVNPSAVTVVGVAPPTLIITTGNQSFYPQAPTGWPTPGIGVAITFPISSTGGVLPIQYSLDLTATNTLLGVGVYGTEVIGIPEANGTYQVGIKAVDAVGHVTTKLIQVTVQAQNSTTYTIYPVVVTVPGTNPAAWTITQISGGVLPDSVVGSAYIPGASQFYGFALYQSGSPYCNATITSTAGDGGATFSLLQGSLPAWMSVAAPSGTLTRPAPGIVFINQTGGSTPAAGDVGSTSVLAQFTSIVQSSLSVTATAVKRESITVEASGTFPSPTNAAVVSIIYSSAFTIDLATTPSWIYPLVAEGGTGPYTFQVRSGTTLPNISLTTGADNTIYFTSSTQQTGTYQVVVRATDSNSIQSTTDTTISVTINKSVQQPIHILNNNLPAYMYAGRSIPASTYYVQSDLVANWTATGLPTGVTLTGATGTRAYLQGTPTVTGINSVVVTATSASFGTTASQSFSLQIKARSATMVGFPTSAVVGVSYRSVNNNAILNVAYIGYQPNDSDLPLLTSVGSPPPGTVGAPGTLNGGQPTTQVTNLTFDGFNMAYDYKNNTVGTDTIGHTTANPIAGLSIISVVYPTLVATGTNITAVVSEYAATASFAAPVSVVGGNQPYSINITGESDARFVPQNNNSSNAQLGITVNQFSPGGTYVCSSNMTVTDTEVSPQTSTTSGVITVQIKAETTITVLYNAQSWSIVAASTPGVYSLTLPVAGVTVQLAHLPVQYNVTSVTIPGGLTGKVTVSPTSRVISINTNLANSSVNDVNSSLQTSGSFSVPFISTSGLAGSYTIGVSYQVIDSQGITSTGSGDVNVVIS